MNKILKFKKTDKIVFMSDLHLGHDRDFLWEPRGFNSEEEHREAIIKQWHELIDEDTIVFNLGDVCFNDPKGERFTMVSKLPCKAQYILWGNHCSGMKQCYNKALGDFGQRWIGTDNVDFGEVYPLQYNNVVFCGNDLCIRVGKQEIHLSHFPKRIWDHMGWGVGSIHLNGHSHGNDVVRNVDTGVGKTLDVGVENALKHTGKFFFTYEEVNTMLSEREIVVYDHHNEITNPSR